MDFNKEATNWDNEDRDKRAKIIADEIKKAIQRKEKGQALEFGCGTGLVSFHLQEEFEHITMVDTSEGMIEILNQKILQNHVNNMTAIRTDLNQETPMLKQTYDVIYTSMALHHIIDIDALLAKLIELLKEQGLLCIVDLVEEDGSFHKMEKDFRGHNGFDQSKLKDTLLELGLQKVETNIFYNGVKSMGDSEIAYALFLMVGEIERF